jgi:hypothetical protein
MSDARVVALDGALAPGSAVGQRGALASGISSGLLGGAVMAVSLALAASAAGMPGVHPLKVMGAAFVGPEAFGGGWGPVLYGAALHALMSIGLGLVYAAVVPRDLPPLCAAVVGIGYAMFVAGIMASSVMPTVNPGFRAAAQPIGGAWVMAHALFGAALGLSYTQRRSSRDAARGP